MERAFLQSGLLAMLVLGLASCDEKNSVQKGKPWGNEGADVSVLFNKPEGNKEHTYSGSIEQISAGRSRLGREWEEAEFGEDGSKLEKLTDETRARFCGEIYHGLIPHWMGTPWDFNGTTETPGVGSIACGYFVPTVLRDAGLNIQRVYLAQQASEVMIKAMVDAEHIKRFRGVPIGEFAEKVRQWGAGLYVVGLDNHTGFITYDGVEVRFIHAGRSGVVSELAEESLELVNSRYRVLGNLSASDKLLKNWLFGNPPRT